MQQHKINKFNKSFSINSFDQRLHQIFRGRKKQQVKAKYRERPFYDRMAKIAFWLLLLSFGCSVFSAYSEHFYLKNFIQSSVSSSKLSLMVMVVLILVIELIKRSTLPSVFQYYFQYGKIDKVSAVIVVIFSAISIFSSFEGAKLIPANFSPSPTLFSLDSIKNEYAAQMTVVDESIKKQEATTWKGRITAQANKNIAQLNRQKRQLFTMKNDAVLQANQQNQELVATYQLKLVNAGNNIGYATLICEALLFLIIGFLEYRDFTLFALDSVSPQLAPSTTTTIPAAPSADSTVSTSSKNNPNDEGKRGQIGFKSYEKENKDGYGETKEVIVEVHHGNRVRNCLRCDTQFTYKHWNKKYCSTNCRVLAWEARTGKKVRGKKK